MGIIEINNSTKTNKHILFYVCENAFETEVSLDYINFNNFQNYILGDNAERIGASDEKHNSASEDDK